MNPYKKIFIYTFIFFVFSLTIFYDPMQHNAAIGAIQFIVGLPVLKALLMIIRSFNH